MRISLRHFGLLAALVLGLGACAKKSAKVSLPSNNNNLGLITSFTCNAVLSKTVVAPGETVSLQVSASGGTAPYSIPNYSTGFASTATLYGSFINSSSTDLVQTRGVSVLDATGKVTTCGFTVTVQSASAGATNLACQIDASPLAVKPGASVTLTVTASGGNGTYQFGAVTPRTGTSLNPTVLSATQANVSTSYAEAGTYTIYTTVVSNGRSATCSKDLLVSDPSLTLYALPSSTSEVSSPITIQSNYSGFGTGLVPVHTYTTAEPGIQITKSAGENSAEVKVTDGQPHDFLVNVSASLNGVVASSSIRLTFAPALSCFVSIGSNQTVGSPIRFTASASTGEPLQITEFVGADSVLPVSVNALDARFLSSGLRFVKIKARSVSRNIYCNGGAYIVGQLTVSGTLNQCDLALNPAVGMVGTPVQVSAVLPVGVGVGPFQISLSSNGLYSTVVNPAGLSQTIRFTNAGTWKLDMSVIDLSSGKQVTCSGYHIATGSASGGSGLEARVFNVGLGYLQLTNSFDGLTSAQKFTAADINVADRSWLSGFPGVVNLTTGFVVSFRGKINVTTAGFHSFKVRSDDGAILYIDGGMVVNDPIMHNPRDAYGSIYLTAGQHDIKLLYWQAGASYISCQLSWQMPGQLLYTPVPASAFSQPTSSLP